MLPLQPPQESIGRPGLPVACRGLEVRLAEAAAQVSNRAGDIQVEGARKALAHGGGGFAMQTAACVVVERKYEGKSG